jgi:hypothetical protein
MAGRLLALKPLPLLLLFVGLAVLHRAPALLFHDLNMDEELYRLIGGALARGEAPYLGLWDRKPVGIFLLVAGIEIAFGPTLAAFRLATAAAVALGAWLLALAVRRLLPDLPGAGVAAGLLAILFSIGNGGQGMNAELFFTPLGLAGLVLALRAAASGGHPGAALLAGLCYGAAIQVKQFAVFDIAGHAVLVLLAGLPRGAGLAAIRRMAPPMIAGALLPSLLVLGWYAAIGGLPAWIEANLGANLGLVGAAAAAFNGAGVVSGLLGFDLLVAGTAATLIAAPALLRGAQEWRVFLGLLFWLAAMVAMLVFGRRFADHFFLQLLPPLAVATALGLALGARALAGRRPPLARIAPALLVAAVAIAGIRIGAGYHATAAEVLWRRQVLGQPHWGDRSATIAAAIRPRIEGEDGLLVVSRLLGLHRLTGTAPLTRFPFALHLVAGYAPVEGPAEMARMLAARPGFIVVERGWLARRPGRPDLAGPVFGALEEALARYYRPDGSVGLFQGWRGVVGGSVDALVFRRADLPEAAPPPGLQYRLMAGRAAAAPLPMAPMSQPGPEPR